MTLIKWAHRPALSLFDEIDRMFNTFNIDYTPGFDYDNYNPKFEVIDIDDAYILRGDFPGISKKDVNIEISDGVLTISGERKNDYEDRKDSYNSSAVSYGKFSKSFNLPDDIKENQINAKMKNGVLSLEIPRMAPVKPDVKKISIK
tara:strand:- start:1785 stop:2222 length:438 start_codon:yes stop_codon:yes gene_type:complete